MKQNVLTINIGPVALPLKEEKNQGAGACLDQDRSTAQVSKLRFHFFPQAVSSVAGYLSLSTRLDTPLVWVVKLSLMLSIVEHYIVVTFLPRGSLTLRPITRAQVDSCF